MSTIITNNNYFTHFSISSDVDVRLTKPCRIFCGMYLSVNFCSMEIPLWTTVLSTDEQAHACVLCCNRKQACACVDDEVQAPDYVWASDLLTCAAPGGLLWSLLIWAGCTCVCRSTQFSICHLQNWMLQWVLLMICGDSKSAPFCVCHRLCSFICVKKKNTEIKLVLSLNYCLNTSLELLHR